MRLDTPSTIAALPRGGSGRAPARIGALVAVAIATLAGYLAMTAPAIAAPSYDGISVSARVDAAVVAGSDAAIAVAVTSADARLALVDIEVYDASNRRVLQRFYDAHELPAGQPREFAARFTPPRPGTYTLKVGVFEPSWASLLVWDDQAATITAAALELAAARGGPAPTEAAVQSARTEASALLSDAPLLQLGVHDAPGGAARLGAVTGLALRYQYLAGGANTGEGWATWNAGGAFVRSYIEESAATGITPVFTYYQLAQSSPGHEQGGEQAIVANLASPETMRAYWADMKLFFERAAEFPDTAIVLHVEPTLWAAAQRRGSDDPAAVLARVGSSGLPELAALPDDISGFARGVVALRDRYAPNVALAYHLGGPTEDERAAFVHRSDDEVDTRAWRAARYVASLGADFDLVFTEPPAGDPQSGDPVDEAGMHARHARFLAGFTRLTGEPVVLWRFPVMRAPAGNGSPASVHASAIDALLGDASATALKGYAQAGVVAVLFDRSAPDAADVVRVEETRYLEERAAAYYARPLALPDSDAAGEEPPARARLSTALRSVRARVAAAFVWPARGGITSPFGPAHPLGIDVAVAGQPVVAAAGGQVAFAGGDPCCGYGYYVVIRHSSGLETRYAHLASFAVAAGQWVAAGQPIAVSGNTGQSSGPHLHFEVLKNGVPQNPLSYLQ